MKMIRFLTPSLALAAALIAGCASDRVVAPAEMRGGVPATAAGLMVSAPGQSLPNEFHVFINEFYGADLYVATEAGLWKVSAGLVIRQQ